MSGFTCPVCGAINGHVCGCPESPPPEPLYRCFYCGEDIFEGDEMYRAGNDVYCAECCTRCIAEREDYDDI